MGFDVDLELELLIANLIEQDDKQNKFLKNLFSYPSSVWFNLIELLGNDDHLKTSAEMIEKNAGGRLDTQWIDYPLSQYGEGYCLLLFWIESLHTYKIALYHRERFLKSIAL